MTNILSFRFFTFLCSFLLKKIFFLQDSVGIGYTNKPVSGVTMFSRRPRSPGNAVTTCARLSPRSRVVASNITLSVSTVSCQTPTGGGKIISSPSMSRAGITTTNPALLVRLDLMLLFRIVRSARHHNYYIFLFEPLKVYIALPYYYYGLQILPLTIYLQT